MKTEPPYLLLGSFQLFFGSLLLWLALRAAPTLMRGGEPWPNQRFIKTIYFVLGLTMVVFSIWGFYLGRR